MALESAAVRAFVERQGVLWNEGRREEFVEANKAVAPAGFRVENPVGSIVESGWGVGAVVGTATTS